ncbi:uncharacterized protein V1516DRAFT_663721 [Lipomyces oligophaga]|uniref:uncharacterized protein n=1 Tax=Lipomyces oligophaga TaxID=45792 RepID=UPI0034CE0C7D
MLQPNRDQDYYIFVAHPDLKEFDVAYYGIGNQSIPYTIRCTDEIPASIWEDEPSAVSSESPIFACYELYNADRVRVGYTYVREQQFDPPAYGTTGSAPSSISRRQIADLASIKLENPDTHAKLSLATVQSTTFRTLYTELKNTGFRDGLTFTFIDGSAQRISLSWCVPEKSKNKMRAQLLHIDPITNQRHLLVELFINDLACFVKCLALPVRSKPNVLSTVQNHLDDLKITDMRGFMAQILLSAIALASVVVHSKWESRSEDEYIQSTEQTTTASSPNANRHLFQPFHLFRSRASSQSRPVPTSSRPNSSHVDYDHERAVKEEVRRAQASAQRSSSQSTPRTESSNAWVPPYQPPPQVSPPMASTEYLRHPLADFGISTEDQRRDMEAMRQHVERQEQLQLDEEIARQMQAEEFENSGSTRSSSRTESDIDSTIEDLRRYSMSSPVNAAEDGFRDSRIARLPSVPHRRRDPIRESNV